MTVNKVIFSSGTLPVEWKQQKPRLDKQISEIHIVRPKDDEYYSLDIHEKEVKDLRELGFNVMSHKPNGTHKLSSAVIEEILQENN